MTPIFIDTSFFVALALEDDALWRLAHAWLKVLQGPFVTTEFVLLEIGDSLSKVHLRPVALNILSYAADDPMVTIVPADSNLFERGRALFQQRLDKEWSLTDCISFEVMREMKITDALTHDHHFAQAGFRALLREAPPNN